MFFCFFPLISFQTFHFRTNCFFPFEMGVELCVKWVGKWMLREMSVKSGDNVLCTHSDSWCCFVGRIRCCCCVYVCVRPQFFKVVSLPNIKHFPFPPSFLHEGHFFPAWEPKQMRYLSKENIKDLLGIKKILQFYHFGLYTQVSKRVTHCRRNPLDLL